MMEWFYIITKSKNPTLLDLQQNIYAMYLEWTVSKIIMRQNKNSYNYHDILPKDKTWK
jgi:hypothetical protein